MTTGWIAEASNRWDRVAAGSDEESPLLDAALIAEALGRSVAACHLCETNGRSRIYRIEFDDRAPVIAKQLCVGKSDELEHEYKCLASIARMSLRHATVPEPIQYLPALRTYLMQRVTGSSIDRLIRWRRISELNAACHLAGAALGELHGHWCADSREVAVHELWRDLEHLALPLSSRESRIIVRALQRLRGEIAPVGQPYLDFKPANLIFENQRIVLIDPPEKSCCDDLLTWDVAVFRQCLEQESWAAALKHPFSSCRPQVRRAAAIFQRAYLTTHPEPVPTRIVFDLLVTVLELQRIGQLLALQRGKLQSIRSARYRNDEWCRGIMDAASIFASLPWLQARARRLIRRIGRLHSRADCSAFEARR